MASAAMSPSSPSSLQYAPPSMQLAVRQRYANQGFYGRPGGVTRAEKTHAWLRDYITAIKHGRWHPFTPLERRVREATRNEPWGPTGMLLNELAEASFNYADCRIIFAVLEFRLGYPAAKWRNVYKALTVLEFLLKRGSEACVTTARDDLMFRLEDLSQRFDYLGPDGKDHGVNVRHRAGAIFALMKDEARLEAERKTFEGKRHAYGGFARTDAAANSGLTNGYHPAGGFFHEDAKSPQTGDQHTPERRQPAAAAGETKGVTLEENRRHLAALREMLQDPANKLCADCGTGRSSWASINCGVFVCLVCAGVHRGLGVHVSKVRSTSLDTWLPEQVAFMAATGNAVAKRYWESRLAPSERPRSSSDTAALEAFVRRKYEARAWARGKWPPEEALPAAEPEGPSEEELAAAREAEDAAAREAEEAAAREAEEAAFREEQRQLEEEVAAAARRTPPPNLMDIDAEWDADPLAYAGATVIRHTDDGATSASQPSAPATAPALASTTKSASGNMPSAAAPSAASADGQQAGSGPRQTQLPAAGAAAQEGGRQGAAAAERKPGGGKRRSQEGLLPPPPPSATERQQPASGVPTEPRPVAPPPPQQQQQQQQQQQRRSQRPRASWPSIMDAAPPRRRRPVGPARDPFTSVGGTSSTAPASASGPQVSAGMTSFSNGGGGGSSNGRQQPDAGTVAAARSAMAYQQEDFGTGDAGGGSGYGLRRSGASPMSVAQAALDRLARARAVATEPVLPPASSGAPFAPRHSAAEQQPPPVQHAPFAGRPPAQQQPYGKVTNGAGELPQPTQSAARDVQQEQQQQQAQRPPLQQQNGVPGEQQPPQQQQNEPLQQQTAVAGKPQPPPPQQQSQPQVYTSRFSTQRPRKPYDPLGQRGGGGAPSAAQDSGSAPSAANAPGSARPRVYVVTRPITPASQQSQPQQQQQQQQPSLGWQADSQQQRQCDDEWQQRKRQMAGYGDVAPQMSAVDAIGSGGLGFRAPVPPRVSPLEAFRQQMAAAAANGLSRASAPILHRTTPIKALKAGAAVSVHSDATGRLQPQGQPA